MFFLRKVFSSAGLSFYKFAMPHFSVLKLSVMYKISWESLIAKNLLISIYKFKRQYFSVGYAIYECVNLIFGRLDNTYIPLLNKIQMSFKCRTQSVDNRKRLLMHPTHLHGPWTRVLQWKLWKEKILEHCEHNICSFHLRLLCMILS